MNFNFYKRSERSAGESREGDEFAVRAMICPAVGAKPDHAHAIGEALVGGDYRGHVSHGLQRLGLHCLVDWLSLVHQLMIKCFFFCPRKIIKLFFLCIEMYVKDIQ